MFEALVREFVAVAFEWLHLEPVLKRPAGPVAVSNDAEFEREERLMAIAATEFLYLDMFESEALLANVDESKVLVVVTVIATASFGLMEVPEAEYLRQRTDIEVWEPVWGLSAIFQRWVSSGCRCTDGRLIFGGVSLGVVCTSERSANWLKLDIMREREPTGLLARVTE